MTGNTFKYLICFSLIFILAGCTSSNKDTRDKANYRLEIAQAMIAGGNYPGALKELLAAEEADPTNAGVQSALGMVYFMREKYDLSERHYLKAIKIKPDFTQARNDLARAYIETGRYARAEEQLKIALEDLTYANYQFTYAIYGVLEFHKKNYKQAIVYLKKSLEKDRENCVTQVYLGRSYLESKDMESALAQLERAVSFCASIEADIGHYYSAIGLYRSGQIEKAQLRFEELISVFPNGLYREKATKMLDLLKKGNQ